MNISQTVRNILEPVIQLRKELHQIPELAYQEYQTAEKIKSFISGIDGLEIRDGLGKTGFVATLNTGQPGPCIAFRADMDGLPIQEQTKVPYASRHEGRMHACGHDGHCAILAGLVHVLSDPQVREQLQGPVKFIFQPAEEGGAGAKQLVDAGVLENPDVTAIFGLHGWPELELGKVATVPGPFFASTDSFKIEIKGIGGHAAFPHKTIDPLPIAASIISAAQTVVSRSTDPLESCVVSMCEIHGGHTYNVIPDTVTIRGTIRCFKTELRSNTIASLEKLIEGIASAHGARATFQLRSIGYPPLVNDDKLSKMFESTADDLLGHGSRVDVKPVMGGEDFAFYAQKVPACFWLLGLNPSQADKPVPFLHHPSYDFNDDAIETGLLLQTGLALSCQKKLSST